MAQRGGVGMLPLRGFLAPILSLYACDFSVGTTMVGMIITTFGIGRLLADLPAGVLSQRFGRKPLSCAGPAFIVVGAIGAALADDVAAWISVRGKARNEATTPAD